MLVKIAFDSKFNENKEAENFLGWLEKIMFSLKAQNYFSQPRIDKYMQFLAFFKHF